jgi:glycosyltransferase involved in cell wall biosynthesis
MLTEASTSTGALRVSVIIEWENVQLAEMDRCQAMLRQLHRQARALRRAGLAATARADERAFLQRFTPPVEVLVLFDDDAVEAADVARIVYPIIPAEDSNLELRLVAASGNEYYDQKNFGASQARGDFIVFLDSDVIPEDGWLQALLGSFENPDVEVACGNAYIDPYNTFAKAFALAWFFPLRSEDGPVYRTREFFANNLAFRREVLERFPFPSMPEGMTRGACVALGQTLAENGVGVYRNPAARVSHPPPVGVQNFVNRAVAEGRDDVLINGWMRTEQEVALGPSLGRFGRRMSGVVRNLVSERKKVNLSLPELPIAAGVAGAYYVFYTAGNLLTRVNPEMMRKRFQL